MAKTARTMLVDLPGREQFATVINEQLSKAAVALDCSNVEVEAEYMEAST